MFVTELWITLCLSAIVCLSLPRDINKGCCSGGLVTPFTCGENKGGLVTPFGWRENGHITAVVGWGYSSYLSHGNLM